MAKKKSKWNRKHEFQWKTETKSTKGHPAYVYAQSRKHNKYIVFTHSSTTDGEQNIKLKHNIDPLVRDRDSYVRPKSFVDSKKAFEKTDKIYRIHKSDRYTIDKIKKRK